MRKNMETVRSDTQKCGGISRRDFIAKTAFVGAGLAVSSLSCASPQNQIASNDQGNTPKAIWSERRKLGPLEVSALGLGCMSMNGGQYPPQGQARNDSTHPPSRGQGR
jgi:hypothetical protein